MTTNPDLFIYKFSINAIPWVNDILFLYIKSPTSACNTDLQLCNIEFLCMLHVQVPVTNSYTNFLHLLTTCSHFYFIRINRIIRFWNMLLFIDIKLPWNWSRKTYLADYFWTQIDLNFDSNNNHTLHILCSCNSCSLPTHHLRILITVIS